MVSIRMNEQMSDMDTKPWYKQFWPWFIISLPASAVIAGITTVIIAFKNADDMVVDDYYKEGKAINQRTELLNAAYDRGFQARFERLEGNFIFIRFETAQPDSDQLTLNFVHPTDSDKDFTMLVSRQADGSYQGLSPNATEGRWYLRLTDPQEWLIKSEIVATSDIIQLKPTKT